VQPAVGNDKNYDPNGVEPNTENILATYTQIIYHVVFATKHRECVLAKPRRDDLFRYIWGIVKNHEGHLFRINGVEDHVHILTSLHPTVTLADLVKAIKTGSAKWIKENQAFPQFDLWQEGYGAFTHSIREKDALIEYIKNQEAHHGREDFLDEYRRLLHDAGVEFDEKYLL
jgi:REP element-mobilizing transposase RayT